MPRNGAHLSSRLAKFATTIHKPSRLKNLNRGKIKEKILCPCLNCQRWRKSFFRPGIYIAIQKVIRETVKENIELSKEIDNVIQSTSGLRECSEED